MGSRHFLSSGPAAFRPGKITFLAGIQSLYQSDEASHVPMGHTVLGPRYRWKNKTNPQGKLPWRRERAQRGNARRALSTPDSPFSVPNSVWALASPGGGNSVRKGLGKEPCSIMSRIIGSPRGLGGKESVTAVVRLLTPGYFRCAGPVARTDQ